MHELLKTAPPSPMALPEIGVAVRPATLADIPFIDSLQRLHTRQVGWMPTKQFEGKIRLGHVLVAEEVGSGSLVVGSTERAKDSSSLPTTHHQPPTPAGYLIGNDQYFKRDDVGIIYQMNVVPAKQRSLVAATLLKAQFERSAYGCRLYCCWCAQDIAANKFWEAMGFVPLAFRTGSEKKARTHIFWQKRIRSGDVTTPWWFPAKTAGGSIREDRLVLPIPPGTHWSDAKPLVLPGEIAGSGRLAAGGEERLLVGSGQAAVGGEEKKTSRKRPALPTAHYPLPTPVDAPPVVRRNGLSFDIPQPGDVMAEIAPSVKEKSKPAKPPRVKRVCDPRLVTAARELRDRWLEQVNASPLVGSEKYAIGRSVGETLTIEATPMKLLAA